MYHSTIGVFHQPVGRVFTSHIRRGARYWSHQTRCYHYESFCFFFTLGLPSRLCPFGSYFSVVIGTCSSKTCQFESKKLHPIQEIVNVREWIFRIGLMPNHWFLLTYFQFATKVLRGCYSPEAWTQATFSKLAGTTWRETRRKAARSCSDFQGSIYSLDVFCTLCILFFGLAFVCFVLVCLFKHVLLITFDFSVSLIIRQTSTATATSTLAVSVRYNFIHFFAVLLQSKTWKGHILRRDRELQW